MKKTVRAVAILALLNTCAYAQEQDSIKKTNPKLIEMLSGELVSFDANQLKEVVISDTKFAMSQEKSGKVITVISQLELQQKAGQNLAQVLKKPH